MTINEFKQHKPKMRTKAKPGKGGRELQAKKELE